MAFSATNNRQAKVEPIYRGGIDKKSHNSQHRSSTLISIGFNYYLQGFS